MTRRRSSHLLPLLVVLALLAPKGARADAAREADEATRRGVQARRERRDEDALAEFRRAYALAPTPRLRAQIALAEQALGRWTDADADLRAALASSSDDWIAKNHVELETALGAIATHLDHPAPPPPSPSPPPAGPAPASAPAPAPAPTHDDASASSGSSQRTWGWVALGGAGAFLVGGVVFTAVRQGHVGTYNDPAQCPPATRSTACASERDAGDRALTFAVVGYGAAAALAITGAVLLATAPKSPVRAGAWIDGHGAGAAVGASF